MRSRSLRLELIALIVVVITGAVLVASLVHGWLAVRELKQDVRARAANIVADLAFSITTLQELSNRELLAAQIRSTLAARPTLRWIDVYSKRDTGELSLFVSSRSPLPANPPDVVRQAYREGRTQTAAGSGGSDETWVAAAPIVIDRGTVGVVTLALSLEGAQRLAAGLREQLLVVLVAAGLTIIAGLGLFIERRINSPIRALLDTMRAVEEGNLQASLQIPRRDEMGQLAEGLESMLRRIRESHAEVGRLIEEINQFNRDLQRRVAEATGELARRNEEVRRANELLFDLQRRLGRAQHLATVGQLSAAMAHEIGAPLNALAVHLQLLGRSGALTDQDRQRLGLIDGQIKRLVRTVEQTLTLTRTKPGPRERADLNHLVRSVTDLLTPILTAKGIDCTFAMETSLPAILAVPYQVQQVVLNLLTNAVDAMPGGGSLRLETGVAGDAVFLRVADSGPGIPLETRERVFEPFFTTKERGGGTGLGLAICRQIVEAHQGTITVGDTPGGGTTFEVQFPPAEGGTAG